MGPIMAIGGVDMLIPPSALTVLLGSLAGISISGLLIAGVVPGILLSVMFVGYIVAALPGSTRRWRRAFEQQPVIGWARWRPLLVYVTPLVRSSWWSSSPCRRAGPRPPNRPRSVRWPPWPCASPTARSPGASCSMRCAAPRPSPGMILFIIIGATTFSQILSLLRRHQRAGQRWCRARAVALRRAAGDDADPAGAGLLHRPGQHDADHAALLHAAGAALRLRPAVVRRDVPDLHAAGPADAALRHAAVHHAQRGAEVDHHAADLSRRSRPMCCSAC